MQHCAGRTFHAVQHRSTTPFNITHPLHLEASPTESVWQQCVAVHVYSGTAATPLPQLAFTFNMGLETSALRVSKGNALTENMYVCKDQHEQLVTTHSSSNNTTHTHTSNTVAGGSKIKAANTLSTFPHEPLSAHTYRGDMRHPYETSGPHASPSCHMANAKFARSACTPCDACRVVMHHDVPVAHIATVGFKQHDARVQFTQTA